jgi:hypothetical protein
MTRGSPWAGGCGWAVHRTAAGRAATIGRRRGSCLDGGGLGAGRGGHRRGRHGGGPRPVGRRRDRAAKGRDRRADGRETLAEQRDQAAGEGDADSDARAGRFRDRARRATERDRQLSVWEQEAEARGRAAARNHAAAARDLDAEASAASGVGLREGWSGRPGIGRRAASRDRIAAAEDRMAANDRDQATIDRTQAAGDRAQPPRTRVQATHERVQARGTGSALAVTESRPRATVPSLRPTRRSTASVRGSLGDACGGVVCVVDCHDEHPVGGAARPVSCYPRGSTGSRLTW